MEGSIAKLPDILEIARKHDAIVVMDDSHATGVLGATGRGTAEHFGVLGEVDVITSTLGKALGGHGAAVVGDADLIGHLVETARPYIYTTAMPPAQAAATLAAVRLARSEHWRREKLGELAVRFRAKAKAAGLVLLPSDTPIQPVLVGEEGRALSMAASLERSGYLVAAIRPPTVPEGRARLRVTLSALHTPADVDGLVQALAGARDRAEAEARVAAITGWAPA